MRFPPVATLDGHRTSKGRTIRYLRGGGGGIPKKIRAQKKSRKKILCTTNLLKKKIEQELGVIFKIVMQLSKTKIMPLGHLKKISCKGMLQKKQFLQAIGG
jgi:hypothetical protein